MRRVVLGAIVGSLFAFSGIAQEDSRSGSESILPKLYQSVVITSKVEEPDVERKDGEVFKQTLFSRDDQVFHLLDAGINAGQHEGGGKSVEIRRFGYNLDHGGVGGGLKILVDDVQQNQGTQGHGQGYLGSLKSLSPELIEEVNLINGPFSAEYGDFSGLGVVHIKMRESMPDIWTARMQGGSYDTARGFLAFSPLLNGRDVLLAYEGSFANGPFLKPLDYRRDNFTGNYGWMRGERDKLSVRFNGGRNRFNSSGQPPLDLIESGRFPRYGFVDPDDGGKVAAGTVAAYWRHELSGGASLKVDGFIARSLFDLFSNFTFFLNDPVHGDGIQQHDSRLQEGTNLQYLKPQRFGSITALLTAGANFHANQINVGLYPRIGRTPTGVSTKAQADVTNGAGYAQENFDLLHGRLQAGFGIRYDAFRFDVTDYVHPEYSRLKNEGSLQPKVNIAYRPWLRLPWKVYFNYGRGISSLDARGVAQYPRDQALSTTDFTQAGTSLNWSRVSLVASLFHIARSNELVYVPDDGSLEFRGPSRSYGFETKVGVEITRKIALHGGITKVGNAFFLGGPSRIYVDSAPHSVVNASLTMSAVRGWSGSLRMRAINHYRIDGEDPSIVAAGHTVFDASFSRRINRHVDLSFAADNLLNRQYYETQNYFESRLAAEDAPHYRIHGTPAYGRTLLAGITVRFGGK